MSTVSFADVVDQQINFDSRNPADALVLDLVDSRWMQRLRDISQTANTRLVYMFSEHSRFGHSLGVAFLALSLMRKLSNGQRDQVETYRNAVAAAALLHDIGHLAPGSHVAYKSWFPDHRDSHELVAGRIIASDHELHGILARHDPVLPDTVGRILSEDETLPAWTWEIISGGGWNVDRGNWCIVDSILAGVSYGRYNIPALTDSLELSSAGHLCLRENRLDAMMHFALSRHALYRQVYQHRVLLAADAMNRLIVARARQIADSLPFADSTMRHALAAKSPDELSLDDLFAMREFWWRYHVTQWISAGDKILSDLCARLMNRRLFKTVRVSSTDEEASFRKEVEAAVRKAGYDPEYYLTRLTTLDMHEADSKQSLHVILDSGSIIPLAAAEPLFNALTKEARSPNRVWYAIPEEAKEILGRPR